MHAITFSRIDVLRRRTLAERVKFLGLPPPPLDVGSSDLFWEHHKEEEDEESLEGHQDGVDVG